MVMVEKVSSHEEKCKSLKKEVENQMNTQWRFYEYYLREHGESEKEIAKEKSKVEVEKEKLLKLVDEVCRDE